MRRSIPALAAALCIAAAPTFASDRFERVKSGASVAATADALEAVIGKAGATVFARIDHGGGARAAGMELADSELVIFGNPLLGTPPMQANPLTGLVLPLKVLVYADAEGQVWLSYEQPEETLDDFDLPDDAPYLTKMRGALQNLTKAAAAGQ